MSASSDKRLVGVRAKIERAKHHIRDVEARLRAFGETNPYDVVTESDPKVGERAKFRVNHPLPIEIPIIAGEALNHLRSALDHLVWQLVDANGSKPTSSTCFPIMKSPAEYIAQSPGKIKGLGPGAVQLVNAQAPYPGGNDFLWMLHKLNNIDKHNLLLVVAAHYGPGVATLMHTLPDGSTAKGSSWDIHTIDPRKKLNVIEDGAECMLLVGASSRKMYMDVQIAFQVVFGNPGVGLGEPVVPLLHQLAGMVDGIVDQFVPFL